MPDFPDAPDDLYAYARIGPGPSADALSWVPTSPDPPDDKLYAVARPGPSPIALSWQPTVDEAPLDGVAYARVDGGWEPTTAFVEPTDNTRIWGRVGPDAGATFPA